LLCIIIHIAYNRFIARKLTGSAYFAPRNPYNRVEPMDGTGKQKHPLNNNIQPPEMEYFMEQYAV
jgi:hypothetical protein